LNFKDLKITVGTVFFYAVAITETRTNLFEKSHIQRNRIDRNSTRTNANATKDKYERICVVTNWSQFRVGKAKFTFNKIDTSLCNIILFSSAEVFEDLATSEYRLNSLQQTDYGRYLRFDI
jgi:hypothetical protein